MNQIAVCFGSIHLMVISYNYITFKSIQFLNKGTAHIGKVK